MKAKVLLPLISALFLLAPCASAQKEGKELQALEKFQDALMEDGFDVTPGLAGALNLPEEWCAGRADNALYANNEPYIQGAGP